MSQDAWEALIGFICSSNNNISRISQMVCEHHSSPYRGASALTITRSTNYVSTTARTLATLKASLSMISLARRPLQAGMSNLG